jgi:osmotically-inducible protein OsmY
MKISRATVLAGTLWISTACLGALAPRGARAEDQAEVKKDHVDQRAKQQKEEIDHQAKKEKDHVDERTQAKKDEIDRENSTHTKTTTAGDDVSDAWITTKVKASLVGDKALKGADIHVETEQKGVVVLSGYVPNDTARTRAISLARDTKGVKKVDDKLQLKVAR